MTYIFVGGPISLKGDGIEQAFWPLRLNSRCIEFGRQKAVP